MMKAYIQSMGSVHPEESDEAAAYSALTSNRKVCVEPDYKNLIENAALRRRMSRIVRMGVAAGMMCLTDRPKRGEQVSPGAIITATALGCLADTAKFLDSMAQGDPSLLSPTPFIQSTFNTIGGQIALLTNNQGANLTYVHRGFSFESSLLDSMLMLAEGEVGSVLVGSVDECTDFSFAMMGRLGFWKAKRDWPLGLFPATTKGSIAGEGAHFFLLSNTPSENDYAVLRQVDCLFRPTQEELEEAVSRMLGLSGLSPKDVDGVFTGDSGDLRHDHHYDRLYSLLFPGTRRIRFKHSCGEYATASAYALRQAAQMIDCGYCAHVLVYNHFQDRNHSLMLLSRH